MTRPLRLRRGLLAVVVALPLLLIACGGDDETSSPGDSDGATDRPVDVGSGDQEGEKNDPDDDEWACGLLSDEEVGESVGYQVVSKEGDAMALAVCEWLLEAPDPDKELAMPPMLSLVVLPDENEWELRTSGRSSNDLYEDVDGIGEKAKMAFVEMPAGGQMVQFSVWDGDHGIYLSPSSVLWDGKDEARDALVNLAQMALDRL